MKPRRSEYTDLDGQCDCEAYSDALEAHGEAKFEQARDQKMEESISRDRKPRVRLSGMDGNAFAIMGSVKKAMNDFYETREQANKYFSDYQTEAMSGDYDHLLQTTMKYCEVA